MSDTSHHSILAHQFDDLEQQREVGTLGIWAFLATEVLFFGPLFASFAIYRIFYHVGFYEAQHHLNWQIGAINTAVLLVSSYTVVLAVYAAHKNDSRGIVRALAATIGVAVIFLMLKAVEYWLEWRAGHVPSLNWHWTHGHEAEAKLFLSFYFIMTGIHALHMLVGIGIFLWVISLARKGRFSREYYNPVEISGLYWHFVDVVWIFLYPTLYLLA